MTPKDNPRVYIHPSADVSETASLGDGVVIMENAVVGPETRLFSGVFVGPGVMIRNNVTVDLNARIIRNAEVRSGAFIGACAFVGDGADIGEGSLVGHHCVIGDEAFVASSTAISDRVEVPSRSAVFPAGIVSGPELDGAVSTYERELNITGYQRKAIAALLAELGRAKKTPPVTFHHPAGGEIKPAAEMDPIDVAFASEHELKALGIHVVRVSATDPGNDVDAAMARATNAALAEVDQKAKAKLARLAAEEAAYPKTARSSYLCPGEATRVDTPYDASIQPVSKK